MAAIRLTIEFRFAGIKVRRGQVTTSKFYLKEALGFFGGQCGGGSQQFGILPYVQQDWAGVFEPALASAPSTLSSQEQIEVTVALSNVGAKIDDILRGHQRALYGRTSSELLTTSAAATASRQMAGVKGLIGAYASLLLPRSMEDNEYLRSLLSGDQALLGDSDIAAIYANA